MSSTEIVKNEKQVIKELQAELGTQKWVNKELHDHIIEMKNNHQLSKPSMTEEAMSMFFGLTVNDLNIISEKIEDNHHEMSFDRILHHSKGKDVFIKVYSTMGFAQVAMILTRAIFKRNKDAFEKKIVNTITKKGMLKGYFKRATGNALDSWMDEDMKSGSFQKSFHKEIQEAKKEVNEREVSSH